jgi:hypothetical protein
VLRTGLSRAVVVLVPALALLGACSGNSATTVVPLDSPPTTTHGATTLPGATTIPQAAATTALPTTADGTVGTGYINTDNRTYAQFLQWDDVDGQIQGTLQEDDVSGTPPHEILSATADPMAGQISGKQIALSISGGVEILGQVTSSGFRINIPLKDGSIGSGTFVSSTAGQFNEVVAEMQAAIGRNNRAQAQANPAAASDADAVGSFISGPVVV